MRDNMRLYATLAIWLAFLVMTTAIFVASDAVSNADPNTAVFIALIFALAASISTVAVWISGMVGSSRGQQRDLARVGPSGSASTLKYCHGWSVD